MTARELIEKYLGFFQKKNHRLIPSVSLVPENDPTVLFTTAGMHPLVPYLLGEPHPSGKRLVSLQKCLRTDDINSVGDTYHHTFFLMLGNWSLGDYFKKEAIGWSLEFLTKELKIPAEKLSVTVFAGDADAPRDSESAKIWQSLGIPKEKIYYLPKKDNWWGPAGKTGPCGPDTEIFYDTGKSACSKDCRPGCACGRYFEIWNNVFMEYRKKIKDQRSRLRSAMQNFGGQAKIKTNEEEYYFEPLKQKNVDTGMGVERTVAVLDGYDDNYQTELFLPIVSKIEEISGQKYQENIKAFRIIADHLRAAIFIINDGVEPSNKERGYILRRLIRRSIFYGRNTLKINSSFSQEVAKSIINLYQELFPELSNKEKVIFNNLNLEENKFLLTVNRGYKEIEKQIKLDGKIAFYLYETYGFPWELTQEIAKNRGQQIDRCQFEKEFIKHQELSRHGSKRRFAGGLADNSEATTKLHTATHLLNQALREVLKSEVSQRGSNITAERLRFDFNYQKKLTTEQLRQVTDLVDKKINENLPVKVEIMSLDEAIKKGAKAEFRDKYTNKVKVYLIGTFSIEVCGGPHVDFTGKLGKFTIIKEESAGNGIRRIYGVLTK